MKGMFMKKRMRCFSQAAYLLFPITMFAVIVSSSSAQSPPFPLPTEIPIQKQLDKDEGTYTGLKTWNNGEIERGVSLLARGWVSQVHVQEELGLQQVDLGEGDAKP
jgi:hypothetical protein